MGPPMRLLFVRRWVVSWLAALLLLAACESPKLWPLKQDAPAAPPATPAPPSPPGTPATPAARVPPSPPGTPSLAPLLSRPTPPPGSAGAPAPETQTTAPPPIEGAVRVGLLVPLSGGNASLGQAMLNAAQMALFDWADERFEVVVHDTGDSPERAVRAAQEAIVDGAQLILGPLLAQSVRAIAPVARAAAVPVVAFSSDRAVAGEGAYILGFQPEAEVRRVVGYARGRGFARFAALAPDNDYGHAVVAALRQAAAAGNATVTQVQFYDPNATDFSDLVRRFANYDMRRQALLAQKKELEGRDDEVARRALARLEKLQTLGELPFDALLLPDGGQRLQSIAALLPFYDIDPAKIRMLGTGRWDPARLGAEPALVGGWYPAPPPQTRATFEQRYRQAFGAAPPRLATLAYDAGALAAILGRNEKGADFSPEALTQASGFAGSDGIFRLRRDGGNERGLAVLQVLANGTRVVSPAPESFGP
ncbi:MAG: penicillin-binding protein activator, partial [Pseudomonadota bacterium]